MPVVAVLTGVFVIGFEQLVQWKYGAVGVIGVLLLAVAIKARPTGGFLTHIRPASRTASLASWMAGRKRAHLREEWAAILAGDPENGLLLSAPRRMYYALGFVWAAALMRLSDLTAPLGRKVDWVLSVPSRTNSFLVLTAALPVAYIALTYGLVTASWCSISWWIICQVSVAPLRRMRGIERVSARRAPGKE